MVALGICFLFAITSLYQLKQSEEDLSTFKETVYGSQVVITEPKRASSGIVFIAHGFAGSTSFMRPIAVALAQAGYKTIRYDFQGHGRTPKPYRGDITTTKGATQLFLNQTNQIVDYYLDKNPSSKAVIVGHSMASDIIFRAALTNNAIMSSIGISNYTDVIKKNRPKNVLILNGQWESHLRKKGLSILSDLGVTNPQENTIYGNIETGTARKVTSINNADHVGILYSRQTQKEIVQWIDRVLERESSLKTNAIGIWTALLLLSLFFTFCLVPHLLHPVQSNKFEFSFRNCFVGNLLAGTLTPLLLNFQLLPISSFPSHNYLINHLIVFSIIISFIFPHQTRHLALKNFNLGICVVLFIFYTLIFGSVLDSYVSSFYPTAGRIPLFVLLLFGCVPIAIIIQVLHSSHEKAWIKATLTKSILVLSLTVAIPLNIKELFLLAYAILLLIGFFFVFGFLSNYLSRRFNNPLSIGIANGATLAWIFSTALPLYIP